MKTLLVMRHAKSSWDDDSLADFDRPLNDRGRSAAAFMGKLLSERGLEPEFILCSPAVRARTTAAILREAGGLSGELQFEPKIYEASANTLRQVVSGLNEAVSCAMLIGHNPGIEGFIGYLTGRVEPMPTAALAVMLLDVGCWKEITDNSATLADLLRPRQLMPR